MLTQVALLQDDAHYAKKMYKRFDEPEEEEPLDEKVELGDSQVLNLLALLVQKCKY
jgi:hypothetical protein